MFTNIILSGLVVAGIGMLWRAFFEDSENLQQSLQKNLPRPVFGALECPLCFTFWTSLFLCIIFDPLSGWLPPLRFFIAPWLAAIFQIFFSWMAIGAIAMFMSVLADQLFRLTGRITWMLKNKLSG